MTDTTPPGRRSSSRFGSAHLEVKNRLFRSSISGRFDN